MASYLIDFVCLLVACWSIVFASHAYNQLPWKDAAPLYGWGFLAAALLALLFIRGY